MNYDGRKVMSSLFSDNELLWITMRTLVLNLPPIEMDYKSGVNNSMENVVPESTGIWATS